MHLHSPRHGLARGRALAVVPQPCRYHGAAPPQKKRTGVLLTGLPAELFAIRLGLECEVLQPELPLCKRPAAPQLLEPSEAHGDAATCQDRQLHWPRQHERHAPAVFQFCAKNTARSVARPPSLTSCPPNCTCIAAAGWRVPEVFGFLGAHDHTSLPLAQTTSRVWPRRTAPVTAILWTTARP